MSKKEIDIEIDRLTNSIENSVAGEVFETMAVLEKNYLLTTSVITAMELYSGCRSKRDIKKVEELIADLRIRFVSKSISERALS